ncbi:DUF805 domain-containing protein [Alterisphingorhabdus coralli]|uniref:DUF805 domain-containing protein n=1 Tax=Alterisphingorhabdus coralli TaxID=3071408 RepID=A0AA97F5Z0_9SPHN|nr:DUF805 domain-containing protein [Parasphingorhabdus sp. SCSIO 66989]WOE74999.1 DUF805 domain-containing protein [Parasphingorhabdus sp. SCSIO 66989]
MEWMILPLKRYADFEGRSRRMEYWMFQLFQWLVYIVLILAMVATAETGRAPIGETPEFGAVPVIFLSIFGLFVLGMAIPNIAVTVRRFHDQDQSGWLYLLTLIPYLGPLIVLVFMFLPGTNGENRFGLDPKGAGGNIGEVFT